MLMKASEGHSSYHNQDARYGTPSPEPRLKIKISRLKDGSRSFTLNNGFKNVGEHSNDNNLTDAHRDTSYITSAIEQNSNANGYFETRHENSHYFKIDEAGNEDNDDDDTEEEDADSGFVPKRSRLDLDVPLPELPSFEATSASGRKADNKENKITHRTRSFMQKNTFGSAGSSGSSSSNSSISHCISNQVNRTGNTNHLSMEHASHGNVNANNRISVRKQVPDDSRSVACNTEGGLLGPCQPGTLIRMPGVVWSDSSDNGMLLFKTQWNERPFMGMLIEVGQEDWSVSKSRVFSSCPGSRYRRKCKKPKEFRYVDSWGNKKSKNMKQKSKVDGIDGFRRVGLQGSDDDNCSVSSDFFIPCPFNDCNKKFFNDLAMEYHYNHSHATMPESSQCNLISDTSSTRGPSGVETNSCRASQSGKERQSKKLRSGKRNFFVQKPTSKKLDSIKELSVSPDDKNMVSKYKHSKHNEYDVSSDQSSATTITSPLAESSDTCHVLTDNCNWSNKEELVTNDELIMETRSEEFPDSVFYSASLKPTSLIIRRTIKTCAGFNGTCSNDSSNVCTTSNVLSSLDRFNVIPNKSVISHSSGFSLSSLSDVSVATFCASSSFVTSPASLVYCTASSSIAHSVTSSSTSTAVVSERLSLPSSYTSVVSTLGLTNSSLIVPVTPPALTTPLSSPTLTPSSDCGLRIVEEEVEDEKANTNFYSEDFLSSKNILYGQHSKTDQLSHSEQSSAIGEDSPGRNITSPSPLTVTAVTLGLLNLEDRTTQGENVPQDSFCFERISEPPEDEKLVCISPVYSDISDTIDQTPLFANTNRAPANPDPIPIHTWQPLVSSGYHYDQLRPTLSTEQSDLINDWLTGLSQDPEARAHYDQSGYTSYLHQILMNKDKYYSSLAFTQTANLSPNSSTFGDNDGTDELADKINTRSETQ